VIDTWSLVFGLVFSSIGLGYFIYGRRQSNSVTRYCGIALLMYPYFMEGRYDTLIVGLLLTALPKFIEL